MGRRRDAVTRAVHLTGRRLLTGAVRRVPPGLAERLRAPGTPRALRDVLRRGGVPAAVRTFALAGDPALRFAAADSLVAAQLYWFGVQGWEPELLPVWRYLCGRSRSILELGANIGYFTVQGGLAAPGARYVAVEPHPRSAALCRRNLALNGVTTVELVEAAAAPAPGAAATTLVVPWEQLGAPTVAFLPRDSELPRELAGRPAHTVPVSTVDVRGLVEGVELIKLDVEGQEHTLLAAVWPHLAAAWPTIVVEVLPGTARLRSLLRELCTELGYRCRVPAGDRLLELSPDELPGVDLWRTHRTHDLVFTVDGQAGSGWGIGSTDAGAGSVPTT